MQRRMKVIDQLYNRTVGILHQASWKLDWLESEVERLQKNESETLARGCRNVRAHSRSLHASHRHCFQQQRMWHGCAPRPVNYRALNRWAAQGPDPPAQDTRATKSTLDSLDSATGSPVHHQNLQEIPSSFCCILGNTAAAAQLSKTNTNS